MGISTLHSLLLHQRREGQDNIYQCNIEACIFGTTVKVSLIVHKDKNHYGFKCPVFNCSFYTTANDDMMGHRLACHTKVNKVDPKLIDDLVEDTKKIKVSDVAKARYHGAQFVSKYDVTKTKLRYVFLLFSRN